MNDSDTKRRSQRVRSKRSRGGGGGPKKGKMWRPHDRTVFEEAKGFGFDKFKSLCNYCTCDSNAKGNILQEANWKCCD
jgi:hypothetical protein